MKVEGRRSLRPTRPTTAAHRDDPRLLHTATHDHSRSIRQRTQVDAIQVWRDAQYTYQTICRTQRRKECVVHHLGVAEGGVREGSVKDMVVLHNGISRSGSRKGMKIVVDGAWRKANWEDAIAWINVDTGRDKHACRINANSAFMAEALGVLYALEGARSKGWSHVEVLTDCLLVIKGLTCMDEVDIFVRPVLLDIWYVSKFFFFVSVTKVPRQLVGAAHALAKQCIG